MPDKNVVALYSVTGSLGSGFLKESSKAHEEGKITLVVLHRAGSDTSQVPDNVEKRVLGYGHSDQSHVTKASKDVDILISAIDKVSQEQHFKFMRHSADIKTSTTFIPSDYSINWSREELNVDQNVIAQNKVAVNTQAKSWGVPSTVIHNGSFAPLFSAKEVTGIDVRGNKSRSYGDALNRKIGVTSIPYSSKAVAELVSGPKNELPGSQYTVTEAEWTGQQVADALEKANGSKPEIEKITDDEINAAIQQGEYAALAAGIQKKWGSGDFPDTSPLKPKNATPITLDELVGQAKKLC